MVQQNQQRLCSTRVQIRSLAWHSGLKDLGLLQLQHRLQLWLGVVKKGKKKKRCHFINHLFCHGRYDNYPLSPVIGNYGWRSREKKGRTMREDET